MCGTLYPCSSDTQSRLPMARPSGRGMGLLLWVHIESITRANFYEKPHISSIQQSYGYRMMSYHNHNSIYSLLCNALDMYDIVHACLIWQSHFAWFNDTRTRLRREQPLGRPQSVIFNMSALWHVYVKVTHNLIRFEALLVPYSVRIWSGFWKYFSSYRVTTAKLGQFQALQGQMTLKM